jgi:hypothetical protein
MREALLPWARQKLKAVRAEVKDLAQAHKHAIDHKWNPHALKRALDNARKRYDFYEKALLILEAGYMLFPTGSCDLFAVRTKRRTPDAEMAKANPHGGITAQPGKPRLRPSRLAKGDTSLPI